MSTYQTHVHVERKEWKKQQIVSGEFTILPATAEEHGCRPLSCRQHWKSVVVRTDQVNVEVTIDEHEIVNKLARAAAHNRTGRAVEFGGLLKAKVVKR